MFGRPLVVFAAVALAGCVPGGGSGGTRHPEGPSAARRAGDVVRLRYVAGEPGESGALGGMVQAMAAAALDEPSSREVVLANYVGDLDVLWLAAPTEELWALASGVAEPEEIFRHVAVGLGPESGAGTAKPDPAAVRVALAVAGLGDFVVRRERSALVVRLMLSDRPSPLDEMSRWIDILARSSAASPGAGAYRLDLVAGGVTAASVTLTGRDAEALADGGITPAEVIDRLQVGF